MKRARAISFFLSFILIHCQAAFAGPARDRIVETTVSQKPDDFGKIEPADEIAPLPQDFICLRDISYGKDRLQSFDVYMPADTKDAPVIFMVHGGGWSVGDKSMRSVVENKVIRWVPRGFIFISINYRLMPKVDPLRQAEDVAQALAAAQTRAQSWGGDPSKFILMGHSAGAHLVALLAAAPDKAFEKGAKPWLGTVLLDSAVFDVEAIMAGKHIRLYDKAFGSKPAYWRLVSPFRVLSASTQPMLAVCSIYSKDSYRQAKVFMAKAASCGTRAIVLEQDLSHLEINENLGLWGAYTNAVEGFMSSLDASVRDRLILPANAQTSQQVMMGDSLNDH